MSAEQFVRRRRFLFSGVVLGQLGCGFGSCHCLAHVVLQGGMWPDWVWRRRLFRNITEIEKLSELGVLFLLFEMGLELSLVRLKVSPAV